MSTTLPPSISHPLIVYLADDGNVWAVNSADGRGYVLTGAGSSGPSGPSGDMNKAVFANGSGAANPNEVDRSMSADSAKSLSGGVPLNAPVAITDGTNTNALGLSSANGITIQTQGIDLAAGQSLVCSRTAVPNLSITSNAITIAGPGSNNYFTLGVTNHSTLAITPYANNAGLTLTTGGITADLVLDQTTNDLIVKATAGPNAGKSVNLTAGKWA